MTGLALDVAVRGGARQVGAQQDASSTALNFDGALTSQANSLPQLLAKPGATAPNNPIADAVGKVFNDPKVKTNISSAVTAVGIGTSYDFAGKKGLIYLLVPTKVLLEKGAAEALNQGTLFLSMANADGTSQIVKVDLAKSQAKYGKGVAKALAGGAGAAFANINLGAAAPLQGQKPVSGVADVTYGALLKLSAVPVLGAPVKALGNYLNRSGEALIANGVRLALASLAAGATGVGAPEGVAGFVAAGGAVALGAAIKGVGHGVNNTSVAVAGGGQITGLTLNDAGEITAHGRSVKTTDLLEAVGSGTRDLLDGARKRFTPQNR